MNRNQTSCLWALQFSVLIARPSVTVEALNAKPVEAVRW